MCFELPDTAQLRSLVEREGVDPDDREVMLDMVAVAMTAMAWRNTVMEDWHAEGRLADHEMMRANAQTTRIARQALTECGVAHGQWTSAAAAARFRRAVTQFFRKGFGADRILPDGRTLSSLGQEELPALRDHAERWLLGKSELTDQHGLSTTVLLFAIIALSTNSHWWLMPTWPAHVNAFRAKLADPADQHWKVSPHPGPVPAPVDTRDELARLLLSGPDLLPAEVADYCIRASIGYVVPEAQMVNSEPAR